MVIRKLIGCPDIHQVKGAGRTCHQGLKGRNRNGFRQADLFSGEPGCTWFYGFMHRKTGLYPGFAPPFKASGLFKSVSFQNPDRQTGSKCGVADRYNRFRWIEPAGKVGKLVEWKVQHGSDSQPHPLGRQPDIHDDRGQAFLHEIV